MLECDCSLVSGFAAKSTDLAYRQHRCLQVDLKRVVVDGKGFDRSSGPNVGVYLRYLRNCQSLVVYKVLEPHHLALPSR